MSALCKRKWALSDLEMALPERMCIIVFLPYTICKHSESPDPFIDVPTLPRKLMSVWKPPRQHSISNDFSEEISTAFNHKGWSKVMHGVPQLAFLAWSITNMCWIYTTAVWRVQVNDRQKNYFEFSWPTRMGRLMKCKGQLPKEINILFQREFLL